MKWAEMTTRERDALVAENVMGFEWGSLDNGNEALHPPYQEMPWCLTSFHTFDENGYHHVMPFYTTGLSAALQVAEKFTGYSIERFISNSSYVVRFFEPNLSTVVSKSLPDAICLAALRAVGVDVE